VAVTNFFEDQCNYHFTVRTNKACNIIPQAAAAKGKSFLLYDGSFWTSSLNFYLKLGGLIVSIFFSIVYYALVCFVLYSLYKILAAKLTQANNGGVHKLNEKF
jgi:hypothetical protein